MYSENPITNELVLICINDGDGSQCGYSYQARCDVTKINNYFHFLRMVRAARRWMLANGTALTEAEQTEAGRARIETDAVSELMQYYLDHLKEF